MRLTFAVVRLTMRSSVRAFRQGLKDTGFSKARTVVTATHNFDFTGKSDLAWRQTGGANAIW
jgi:hypothetical protein